MENSIIPTSYLGREQALVKHHLLREYLEKLMLIMGMGSRQKELMELCYVDCFAGPWGDDSEAMESTSIAISLNTLEACRKKLEQLNMPVRVRALYIEESPRAFARLQKFLATSTPGGIESSCLQGDFVVLRAQILKWLGPRAFGFFFIDPKGWSEVSVPILRPLLERPRSEFLINLMYDFVNRTMSMAGWKEEMADLIGEQLDLTGMDPTEREQRIVRAYRQNLKACAPCSNRAYPPRAAHVRVMDPEKDRTKYQLIYLTSHAKGIVEFKRISEQVDKVQHQVRAEKREVRKLNLSGTGDLFGAEGYFDPSAGHAGALDVVRFWRTHLNAGPQTINMSDFADILEETDWFESDLQASLARLIKDGKVANLSADVKRRTKRPLHFEEKGGETLKWIE
ncbi:three-Cys-motif partner protein TcmP [Paraburkholderia sp.]|uniref:three-Cys-motif partner protein TcmP n=1 Tax=Paraburkholderia sp. TaxID=1926495 RepID=UPI0025ED1858|nr:three-Cys-motif partner protein TcmP [Paraburkholderia sp.]